MSEYMNNAPDRELDWDDEITNDGGFVLLPEGDYPYTITKFERARYNGSSKVPPCRMAQLTVAIHGGDNGETSVNCKFFLLKNFQWKLSELFVSAGLADPDAETIRMQWDRIQGATGLCKILVGEDDKILGVHLLGNYSSEIITTATLAVEQELTVEKWQRCVFPHPSVSEILKETLGVFEDQDL